MNHEVPQTTLEITLLGGFQLTHGDQTVATVDTPRLQSLLAYLVLNRGISQSRHRVAFLFWPDSPEDQALTNLRNLLYRLRHGLPEADRFLRVDRNTLAWREAAPFELDVAEFEAALERADEATDQDAAREALERAAGLYGGDLLPGLYEDWIASERERLRQALQRALERLVELLETRRDYRAAIDYARRLVRQDPLHEPSCRHLMRLQALIGDRSGALRTYHQCATILERELSLEPSPATQEMYEQLVAAEDVPAPPPRRARRTGAVSPLVGRQDAWAELRRAWRRSVAGRPHLALISGGAGIGKTRLAEELIEWAARQGIATASARCYPAEGELAYAPVAAWLRARPLPPLEPVWRAEIARLLPELLAEEPDLPEPGPITEPWQQRRFFEALTRALLRRDEPLLLVIDALQWCDRGTLEWLHYLLRFDPRARLLVVGTYRPDQTGGDHPLLSLIHALRHDDQLAEISLAPLSRDETANLAENVADRELNPAVVDCLYRETEGNPLFIVETARGGLPEAVRELPSGGRVCVPRPLPSRIKDALVARIEQLSPLARSVAELAATIGREFTFDVLGEASDAREDRLIQGLDELWQRRIIREQGEDAYDFSHDKLREVLTADLSEARRHMLHRHVGGALERVYADNLDGVAARIAAHYERADEPEEAAEYYQRAAEVAGRMQAEEEAARCRQRALALEEEKPPPSSDSPV
ncbi:MAG: ATP-binding protein [Chloroflexota bacterium]